MSVTSEPEAVGPDDPIHYAPRRLREVSRLKNAVYEPLRWRLDWHAMGESRVLAASWSDAATDST
jgi:hypothetical protein